MSRIKALYNIQNKGWTITSQDVEPLQTFLAIHFETDTELKHFKFGYEIFEDGELKQVGEFPPLGLKYKMSDLAHLNEYPTMLKYNSNYKIIFWAEDAGERSYHDYEFVCPAPKPPYASWTWNGEKHVAPKLDPSDPSDITKSYVWNEDSQEWILDTLMKTVAGVGEGPTE